MTSRPDTDLPLDLGVDLQERPAARPRRRFRKRYLLVLLIPVFMFTGAVLGLYFQPPGLQMFYRLTGLQPGAGSQSPIALPPEIELPQQMTFLEGIETSAKPALTKLTLPLCFSVVSPQRDPPEAAARSARQRTRRLLAFADDDPVAATQPPSGQDPGSGSE